MRKTHNLDRTSNLETEGRRCFSFLGLFSGFSYTFLILFLYFSYTFLMLLPAAHTSGAGKRSAPAGPAVPRPATPGAGGRDRRPRPATPGHPKTPDHFRGVWGETHRNPQPGREKAGRGRAPRGSLQKRDGGRRGAAPRPTTGPPERMGKIKKKISTTRATKNGATNRGRDKQARLKGCQVQTTHRAQRRSND